MKQNWLTVFCTSRFLGCLRDRCPGVGDEGGGGRGDIVLRALIEVPPNETEGMHTTPYIKTPG